MEEILRDLSSAALAAAVEANQAEWVRLKGRVVPGVTLHEEEDVCWTLCATPGRSNDVVAARLAPENADARIRAILAAYRAIRMQAIWWVGPSAAPPDLGERLRAHGMRCMFHLPGMALDLHAMNDGFAAPPDLEIEACEDLSLFERYDHPYYVEFYKSRRAPMLETAACVMALRPQRVWHFVASLDAEPLGAATLFLGAGVAGIYDVGVLKKARRQGIGTAVTLAPLRFARERGCRVAVLQATSDGERVYRRIGFEEQCKISMWYYSKGQQARDGASNE